MSEFTKEKDFSARILELEKEIKKLKSRKKYGLVWEEKPEEVVVLCKEKLPILAEETTKEIISSIRTERLRLNTSASLGLMTELSILTSSSNLATAQLAFLRPKVDLRQVKTLRKGLRVCSAISKNRIRRVRN